MTGAGAPAATVIASASVVTSQPRWSELWRCCLPTRTASATCATASLRTASGWRSTIWSRRARAAPMFLTTCRLSTGRAISTAGIRRGSSVEPRTAVADRPARDHSGQTQRAHPRTARSDGERRGRRRGNGGRSGGSGWRSIPRRLRTSSGNGSQPTRSESERPPMEAERGFQLRPCGITWGTTVADEFGTLDPGPPGGAGGRGRREPGAGHPQRAARLGARPPGPRLLACPTTRPGRPGSGSGSPRRRQGGTSPSGMGRWSGSARPRPRTPAPAGRWRSPSGERADRLVDGPGYGWVTGPHRREVL